ncbi:ALR1 [[Candida] subhashii]|uniref:ALR1 n=1 Tax=[Candida] subhashii TaxID=561895 RepID=A0A8J5UK26_9ASCO|nr:ALR1 [[Candida] subhashii]KAG7661877.1 ALR1 [[Candida] subhashii]
MSDNESYRSSALQMPKADELLHDHRHQSSLPPNYDSSAISDDDDEDEEDEIDDNDAQLQQSKRKPSRRPSKRTPSNVNPDYASRQQRNYMPSLRRDFYLKDEEDTLSSSLSPNMPIRNTATAIGSTVTRRKSHSVNETYSDIPPPPTTGILYKNSLGPPQTSNKKSKGNHRSNSNNFESDLVSPMTKCKTNDSDLSNFGGKKGNGAGERRQSRSSIDSEADSHASRSSQETEEDVCFPLLREHVRINGIDFDEIEEFIKDETEERNMIMKQQQLIAERNAQRFSIDHALATSASSRHSNAALKYTPKNILKKTQTRLSQFRTRATSTNDFPSSTTAPPTIRAPSTIHDSASSYEEEYELKGMSPHLHEDDQSTTSSTLEQVKFGGARITDGTIGSLPDRFSFFHSNSEETVHAPDIPSLVGPGQSVRDLFQNGEETWWLDCTCPTDAEMKMLAKAFGIHPLTAEDIRIQERREKVELFRNYYFVCFHTFEGDKESEDYLELINVYMVIFREGVLSFHFSPITHPANVRRRVRQLREYVDVSADWLCYALIDDITDGFAPVITGIEYEADAIEDSVFLGRSVDFSNMLKRIGESRRKVMALMRLLTGKADVIKMFAKRCQDEAMDSNYQHQQQQQFLQQQQQFNQQQQQFNQQQQHQQHQQQQVSPLGSTVNLQSEYPIGFNQGGVGGVSFGPGPGSIPASTSTPTVGIVPPPTPIAATTATTPHHQHPTNARPRADIALYLGDIQDHVVTMFQNLLAYEKIFSRSHSNYLAQLQVESFNSNNRITEMFSKVTLIGTMLVPLNLITGLFGMNVHVPGEGIDTLAWFFGIVGVLIAVIIGSFIFAQWWLGKLNNNNGAEPAMVSSRRSIKSLGLRRNRDAAKSILSYPNKYE